MDKKTIEYGYILEGKIYRTGSDGADICLTPEKIKDEEQSIRQLSLKFEKFNQTLEGLDKKIQDSENKGSHLMKLLHIKDQLSTHEGLGDYNAVKSKVEKLETYLTEIISNNRKRNTEIKNMLLLELEQAVGNNDMYEAGEQVKNIKSRWIKTGNAGAEVNEQLQGQFSEKCGAFYNRRNAFNEDKKMLIQARIDKGRELITKLESILENKNMAAGKGAVLELQNEWKEIGSIPKKDFTELNDRYWKASKKFYAELKNQKKEGSAKENFSKHLEERKEILQELKQLNEVALAEKVSKKMEALKTNWKSAGRVKKEDATKLGNEFYDTLRIVSEKQFILQRVMAKFKGFDDKKDKEKASILVRFTKELLRRDEGDLKTFQENMDNMHVNKGSFVDMLLEKLEKQRNKVETKKSILSECKSLMDKMTLKS